MSWISLQDINGCRRNLSAASIFLICLYTLAQTGMYCNAVDAKRQSQMIWSKDFPVIGSQSSPRAADLNGDGVLDIVMGAGRNEFQYSEMGIIALDGATGNLLWQHPASDQVFGSANLCELTGDSVPDVLIGGRSPQLKALDGKTGRLLWQFDTARYRQDPVLQYARFNFNNGVLVPDQNGDGAEDLLTVNGGNALAAPGTETNRYPGVLMLVDSRTGAVLAADTMPDGKESYMTPIVYRQPGSAEWLVVLGTGGETISGTLYLASLTQLKERRLFQAKMLAADEGHGFIAPPSLADINADGCPDIMAISHGSKAVAIDGKDGRTLWSRRLPQTECSNSFAVGYFTADKVPDFFTFTSKGTWPFSTGTRQVLIDGRDGSIAWQDSIGCAGFSTPVVYDLNGDGQDEAIISANEYDCAVGYAGQTPARMRNKLLVLDFKNNTVNTIDEAEGLKNIFSTPWIGDLDKDGYLDLVYCQYFHHTNLLSFLGMRIRRVGLPVRMRQPVRWSGFLGSGGNGLFQNKEI